MRVVVHLAHEVRAFSPSPAQLDRLRARLGRHTLDVVPDAGALDAALEQAEAAVLWRFGSEQYACAPRLRHLFTPSAGREPLAPDPSGRVARHFGHFHGALMAESLVAMVTFMNRRLGAALLAQAERRWDCGPFSARRRLHGQVALIVGFGAIGQRCAALLNALGMVVFGLRRHVEQPSPGAARLFSPRELPEALALADHVACVLPGDTSTDQLLDARAFAHIKPGACVYNLGRGNAIDERALCEALLQGRVAGAFLDVVQEEPLPASLPLWTAPNLYLTPHAAAIDQSYLDLYFEELADELDALA